LSLIAAICTNREPAAVRPALAALCEQAAAGEQASVLLVTSGLDDAGDRRHAETAAELGARAVHAGPGVSVARNRALDEANDDDVLAFVDDDAVPASDWLDALCVRWRQADPRVACVGGAITPRWERPPPAWVSRRIDPAFSLLDLGEGVVELDPLSGQDAWGANISFRAGPLREVGAFDPARGAWRGVPLFGDESAVQRRLAERGYRVLYAGDVRVEHRVPAERLKLRELWRRELFRGASAGLDGRVSPAAGAVAAAKSAAGLTAALLTRRVPLAGERFARLARGAGAAASPLLLRRLRRRGWPGP
jgi:glucosyl-dolichyl phosphate glucuronosyltransferase